MTGKKKRVASDDEEKVEEKSTVQQKSSKKQKVKDQEKDARKAQKVKVNSIPKSIKFFFYYFELLSFF